MSFPNGWRHADSGRWERDIEPSAINLTQALMGLPGATIVQYEKTGSVGFPVPVTHIVYDPVMQEAVLS